MTVAELIDKLRQHDQLSTVYIPDADYYRRWEEVKVAETDPKIFGVDQGVYLDSFE